MATEILEMVAYGIVTITSVALVAWVLSLTDKEDDDGIEESPEDREDTD